MADEQGPRSWWQTLPGLITAIAALVTAVAGLVAIWPHPRPIPVSNEVTPAGLAEGHAPTIAAPTIAPPTAAPAVDRRREAEELAVAFVTAMLNRDVNTLTSQGSVPFFMDNEVILSIADLRSRYERMFPKLPAPPTKNTKIEKVEARTIREWKTQGFDPSKDRLLGSIDLGDDEYRILITVPSNGVVIYTRRTPQGLTIAGFWG